MASPKPAPVNQQTVRLLVALTLLLVALAVVIVKDRDFWFASDETAETTSAPSQSVAKTNPVVAPAKAAQPSAVRPATAKNHVAAKPSTTLADTPSKDIANQTSNQASPVVATHRVVLPPLDVEVVAGDTHRNVHPGSNAITTSVATLATNAAEHERLTAASVPELRQTVDATYPVLGQHSQVRGSVVLRAVIGADGTIEDLRVISGPAILATAAQQAVRQWRFRPFIQNGQAVETKTTITVNFSIKVSDDAKTS